MNVGVAVLIVVAVDVIAFVVLGVRRLEVLVIAVALAARGDASFVIVVVCAVIVVLVALCCC